MSLTYLYILLLSTITNFIILIFFHEISLKQKKNISNIYFFSCYILSESVLLFAKNMLEGSNKETTILIFVLRLLVTFLLCFLYDASNIKRIISTVCFISMYYISSLFAYICLGQTVESFIDEDALLAASILEFCSKLFLFIFITLSGVFWKKEGNSRLISIQLVIPLIPLVMIFSFPADFDSNSHSIAYLLLLASCILVVCIYSFWIFSKLLQNNELKNQAIISDKQLSYQRNKYSQLSSAYKDTRRLIHDTKNHYFVIEGYIQNNENEKILPYLKNAIASLEKSYITVNTGNLVIDSLVSNLINIGKNEHININTNIHISNTFINIEDFDMCIILGNLIDNAINAVRSIPTPALRNISVDIKTSENHFSINIINNYIASEKSPSLEHGYGLNNVHETTEKYSGVFVVSKKDEEFTSTVIIPII